MDSSPQTPSLGKVFSHSTECWNLADGSYNAWPIYVDLPIHDWTSTGDYTRTAFQGENTRDQQATGNRPPHSIVADTPLASDSHRL